MYDPLWDEHPKVKKIREDSKHEWEIKGAATALQEAIVDLVQARFPELTDEAQQKVKLIDNPAVLKFLLVSIGSAANEAAAHHLLHPSAA